MKRNDDILNLKRLYIDDLSELTLDDVQSHHCIVLRGEYHGGIYRPSNIRWQMTVTSSSLCEKMPSNKRRRLKKTLAQAEEGGIALRWEDNIHDASFAAFRDVYDKTVNAMPYGVIRLHEDWLERKRKSGQIWSGLFATKGGAFLGGALIQHKPTYMSLAYVAHEHLPTSELNLGLSGLLVNEVYERAYAKGHAFLGYGKDTNFYGHHLSLSLLKYKRWIGFEPRLLEPETYHKETLWIVGLPDNIASIGVFGFHQGTEALNLHIYTDEALHIPEYRPKNIAHVTEGSLSELLRTHRAFLKSERS